MISRDFFEEDIALKKVVAGPVSGRPRFDWGGVAQQAARTDTGRISVSAADGESNMVDLADIAEGLGNALTSLLLARSEQDIFSEKNQKLVAEVAETVAEKLIGRSSGDGGGVAVTHDEVHRITQEVLVKRQAYDLAKSYLLQTRYGEGAATATGTPASGRKVIRRNGEVVTWNPEKIETAVKRAFLELEIDPAPAEEIARSLTEDVVGGDKEYLHIEDLQDRVQEELMRQGHYKVAEAYILYRARRAEHRAREIKGWEEEQESGEHQDTLILVTRADKTTYLWDATDLRKRVEFASIGLDLCLTQEQIIDELKRSIFSEIDDRQLEKTITLNAKSLIERDADFSKFAARILLSYIYEEVLDWDIVKDGISELPAAHRKAFKRNLARGLELERIDPKMLELDLSKLGNMLDPAADLDFDFLGIQTLYDRYLIVDKKAEVHRRLETPQLFWMRVAMGLFLGEKSPEEKIGNLYRLYRSRRFCSSTPTLFNSGTQHSQLSSCYLYKVDDSIESIMQRGIAENAYLSKWAGGLGGSWTAVRGTGGHIHGTNGESQGVIPFLKLHNDQLCAVNQGGKRKGSGCAYLETWHNDIFDFLELRRNTGDERRRTHDMNTANWIPDLFMKRMEARESWTLFRSSDVPDLHDLFGKAFEERYQEYEAMAEAGKIYGEKISAIDVWKAMLRMIFETGHPWITFKDPCNVRSPQDHCGVIHSSNLCTEITLNTGPEETAVCNLGSVVLDNHLTAEGEIDHDKLRETISIAVRALDNVIDINFYPTEAAARSNQRHRPIGLGVMGLQNALYCKGIAFASEEAVEFNDEFMEAIAYYAYEASSDLAAELGTYETYEGSKWSRGILPPDSLDLLEEQRGIEIEVPRGGKLDWTPLREKIARHGMRNSNVLAIAPTATISNIMGSSPCIEPHYKNLFVKSNLSGDFVVLNQFLVRDLKERGLWDNEMRSKLKYHDGELGEIEEIPADIRDKYTTAFGIPFQYFIDAAARRQKWIDQSQSVNLFLAEPDLKTLSHMYRAAWRKGLKTTYYLRTLGASRIEKSTVDVKKEVRGVVGSYREAMQKTAEARACEIGNGDECEACQ